MAQRRMLNKSISISEKVNKLSDKAKLLYTWGIAHSDDFGLIFKSPIKVKGLIVPLWDEKLDKIEILIKEIVNNNLWLPVIFKEEKFYQYNKHKKHQDFRKDIKPILLSGIKAEWNETERIRPYPSVSVEPKSSCMLSEDKLSEDKLSEDKLSEDILQANACEIEIIPDLSKDKQKHIQIIDLFAKAKKITFQNKEQQTTFIKRNLRSASNLKGYDFNRIAITMNYLIDNADYDWKLETIGKYIDEIDLMV